MLRLTKFWRQAAKAAKEKSVPAKEYPGFIREFRHGEIGSKLFPRPEFRDKMAEYNTDKLTGKDSTLWRTKGTGSKHKNQFYEPDEDTTVTGGTFERNYKGGKFEKWAHQDGWTGGKWLYDRFKAHKTHEQDEFMRYVEYTGRGWIKPELMRAMFIVEYGHTHEQHGRAQNPDPFRHFQYDIVRTGDHKYRSIDMWLRRLRDMARDSQQAFVKIHAASFNPIDFWISQGHGWEMFEYKRIGWNRFTAMIMPYRRWRPGFADMTQRDLMIRLGEDREDREGGSEDYDPSISVWNDHRFPLVLGRDFCGTLEDMGGAVGSAYIDDRVWGVRPPYQQGTICDYRNLTAKQFSAAPMNISLEQCAAVPYVGVTLLQGFDTVITPETVKDKRILVIGGTGGAGTLAIQLLHGWGGSVSTICNSSGRDFVKEHTPVECVYEYDTVPEDETVWDQFKGAKFDLIINCSDNENDMYQYIDVVDSLVPNGWYITMNTTMMSRFDKHSSSSFRFYSQTLTDVSRDHEKMRKWFKSKGRNGRWAQFNDAFATYELERLKAMVEDGYIKPVVTKTVPIEDALPAFQDYVFGTSRGKTIVTVDDKC